MGGGCGHYTQERENTILVPCVTSQGVVKSGASVDNSLVISGVFTGRTGTLIIRRKHLGIDTLHIMEPLMPNNQTWESESGKMLFIARGNLKAKRRK